MAHQSALKLSWSALDTLASAVAQAMDHTTLPERAGKDLFDGRDQPGSAVGDDEEGAGEPTVDEALQESPPRLGGLRGAGGETDEVGSAVGVDAPGAQHRLGRRVLVELEVGPVQEQGIEPDLRQIAGRERGELAFDLLADPRHGRLGERSLLAEGLFQGRAATLTVLGGTLAVSTAEVTSMQTDLRH
jgi:hypothetical protein